MMMMTKAEKLKVCVCWRFRLFSVFVDGGKSAKKLEIHASQQRALVLRNRYDTVDKNPRGNTKCHHHHQHQVLRRWW